MNPAIFHLKRYLLELSARGSLYLYTKYQESSLAGLHDQELSTLQDIRDRQLADEELDPLLLHQKKMQLAHEELASMQKEAESLNTPATFV